MKPDDFIHEIEKYYYPYNNPTVRNAVKKYISTYPREHVKMIYSAVLLSFSRSFKIAPDIAILEKTVNEYKIGISLYPEVKEITEKRFSEDLPDDWGAELDRVIGSKRITISPALKDRFASPDIIPRDIEDPETIRRREENKKKFAMEDEI